MISAHLSCAILTPALPAEYTTRDKLIFNID